MHGAMFGACKSTQLVHNVWACSYAVDDGHIVYVHPYTLLYTCAGGGQVLNNLGYWGWAQNNIMGNIMLKGCEPPNSASYIHIACTKSIRASSYAVDGHVGAPFHPYTCSCGGQILEIWVYKGEPNKPPSCMVPCLEPLNQPHFVSQIHIKCLWSVWDTLYAVMDDGHI
jgi:hypothetical protein